MNKKNYFLQIAEFFRIKGVRKNYFLLYRKIFPYWGIFPNSAFFSYKGVKIAEFFRFKISNSGIFPLFEQSCSITTTTYNPETKEQLRTTKRRGLKRAHFEEKTAKNFFFALYEIIPLFARIKKKTFFRVFHVKPGGRF